MEPVQWSVAAALFVTAVLFCLTMYHRRLALSFVALFVALFSVGWSLSLSHAKPLWMEQLCNVKDAPIEGYVTQEPVSITLLLRTHNCGPRTYVVPFDPNMAQTLDKDARDKAEGKSTGLRLTFPFEKGWDRGKPLAYAMPQPKLPDKPVQAIPDLPEVEA
jgi:hypothetical protein